MDDRDIDRLLAGSSTGDDAGLAQLAEVLTAVGDAYPTPSTEGLEASHLAAMMETAHLLAETGELAARPASNAHGPALQAPGLPKLRRTTLKDIWTMKGAKIAAISVAAVLALGGTAYAGVLPAPVQKVVASAVRGVGITLPSAAAPETETVEPSDANKGDKSDEQTGTVGTDQGDQNNVDEGQVGDGSHDESQTVEPGDNGKHLGWTIGKHLGWGKGQNSNDETGTVPPGHRDEQDQNSGEAQASPQSKHHGAPAAGAATNAHHDKGESGQGSGDHHGKPNSDSGKGADDNQD